MGAAGAVMEGGLVETTVPRHCVENGAGGLSSFQGALLTCEKPVILASAPTGSGKSYVFRRAVGAGARVLFIVPTRRLAQNLRVSMIEDLVADGWPHEKADRKAKLFSGQQSREEKETRQRDLRSLDELEEGGEIIFSTPEVISNILLAPYHRIGRGDIGPETLTRYFDWIVFDEYHLYEPRAFGLIGVCASLAAARQEHGGRAKVCFLSATPVDVRPILERLGCPGEKIAFLRETIVAEGRALHGDVRLAFHQGDAGMLELLRSNREKMAACLAQGRRVLVIYDSLRQLKEDEDDLHRLIAELGLLPEEYIFDNSIDASRVKSETSGARHKLEDRLMIVATSGVEVGVTIPALALLFMEPGHNASSFLQRFGRCARGDMSGEVHVSVGATALRRRPWLSHLVRGVLQAGEVLEVDGLGDLVALAGRQEGGYDDEESFSEGEAAFGDPRMVGDGGGLDRVAANRGETGFFSTMSTRAIWCAGLYWFVLIENARRGKGHALARQLRGHAPVAHGVVSALMEKIDAASSQTAQRFAKAFRGEAARLRDIGLHVTVVEPSGERLNISEDWLAENTTILMRHPAQFGDDGLPQFILSDPLNSYLLDTGTRNPSERVVLTPVGGGEICVNRWRSPVLEWTRHVENARTRGLRRRERDPVDAAVRMVRMTGLLPGAESEDRDEQLSVNAGTTLL